MKRLALLLVLLLSLPAAGVRAEERSAPRDMADRLLGKYRTILYLSLIYCAGNAVMACFPGSLRGIYVGLALIAIGSGGIKPCVSAVVGDQFGKGNWHRIRVIYQVFYFSINFGSFFATLLIPITKKYYGAGVAFGDSPVPLGVSVRWYSTRGTSSALRSVTSVPAGIAGID